jgi:hypothetical protein
MVLGLAHPSAKPPPSLGRLDDAPRRARRRVAMRKYVAIALRLFRYVETLLDVLFLFDSVPMDLYPACAEEMYSD